MTANLATSFFVTGTDTGIGKTVISAAILSLLRGEGVNAVPMKPVQTGCVAGDPEMLAPDLEFCLSAIGMAANRDEKRLMAPFKYEPAWSPHLASVLTGSAIDIGKIVECHEALQQVHHAVVVEGAGGVLAPVSEKQTMLDVMIALKLPVVVVAKPGLGTINHTMLTLHELRNAGLAVAGVAFNSARRDGGDNPGITRDNVATIERMGQVQILGNVPFSTRLTDLARYPDAFRMWAATRLALPDRKRCSCSCCE